MAFISFTKAADLAAPDDLRINAMAVLYVEASRPAMLGRTMIHMLGQGSVVNAVAEQVGTVISAIFSERCSLVACTRHYLAAPPHEGASTVYVSPANVSFLRPNLRTTPDFWLLIFVDGSELQIADPLPQALYPLRSQGAEFRLSTVG